MKHIGFYLEAISDNPPEPKEFEDISDEINNYFGIDSISYKIKVDEKNYIYIVNYLLDYINGKPVYNIGFTDDLKNLEGDISNKNIPFKMFSYAIYGLKKFIEETVGQNPIIHITGKNIGQVRIYKKLIKKLKNKYGLYDYTFEEPATVPIFNLKEDEYIFLSQKN